MRQMNFSDGRVEYSFWGNVDYPSNDAAKKHRDQFAKHLTKQGLKVQRRVLRNQLSKYSGLGQPDGTWGNVYSVTQLPKEVRS